MRGAVDPQAHFFRYFSHRSASAARTKSDFNRTRLLPFGLVDGNCENSVAWLDVCMRGQACWPIRDTNPGDRGAGLRVVQKHCWSQRDRRLS